MFAHHPCRLDSLRRLIGLAGTLIGLISYLRAEGGCGACSRPFAEYPDLTWVHLYLQALREHLQQDLDTLGNGHPPPSPPVQRASPCPAAEQEPTCAGM